MKLVASNMNQGYEKILSKYNNHVPAPRSSTNSIVKVFINVQDLVNNFVTVT
jgi:hypothetical protein